MESWILPPLLMAKQCFAPELLTPHEPGGRSTALGSKRGAYKSGMSR